MNITSKIEGYADLSAEEKLAKLESIELEDTSVELKKYKDLIDKASSEASNWKKKYNEKLSESEKIELEQKESQAKIMEELNALRNEKQLTELKANYLGLGYNEDLALATAQAFMGGDMQTVFANQKKFLDETQAKIKADLLNATPNPNVTIQGNVQTEDEKELANIRRWAGL